MCTFYAQTCPLRWCGLHWGCLWGLGSLTWSPSTPLCWSGAYIIQILRFIVYTTALLRQLCAAQGRCAREPLRHRGHAAHSGGLRGDTSPSGSIALAALWQRAVAVIRATILCRLLDLCTMASPCGRGTPRQVSRHRASARAGGPTPFVRTLRGPPHQHTWAPTIKSPHWSLFGGASWPGCPRGRPPMRGPRGAPHGRCQPVRGRWADKKLGRLEGPCHIFRPLDSPSSHHLYQMS